MLISPAKQSPTVGRVIWRLFVILVIVVVAVIVCAVAVVLFLQSRPPRYVQEALPVHDSWTFEQIQRVNAFEVQVFLLRYRSTRPPETDVEWIRGQLDARGPWLLSDDDLVPSLRNAETLPYVVRRSFMGDSAFKYFGESGVLLSRSRRIRDDAVAQNIYYLISKDRSATTVEVLYVQVFDL